MESFTFFTFILKYILLIEKVLVIYVAGHTIQCNNFKKVFPSSEKNVGPETQDPIENHRYKSNQLNVGYLTPYCSAELFLFDWKGNTCV